MIELARINPVALDAESEKVAGVLALVVPTALLLVLAALAAGANGREAGGRVSRAGELEVVAGVDGSGRGEEVIPHAIPGLLKRVLVAGAALHVLLGKMLGTLTFSNVLLHVVSDLKINVKI